MKTIIIAAAIAAAASCLRAQVISPGIDCTVNGTNVYLATVTTSIDYNYDAVDLTLTANNHLSFDENDVTLGCPFTWYVSAPGELIDPTYISQTIRYGDNWGYAFGYSYAPAPLLLPGQSIYLSFWRDADDDDGSSIAATGVMPPPSAIGAGDQIGWVELTRTSSGIKMVASAMDLSGNGIEVGSFTSIPEPSTYAAICAGACLIGVAALRRRHGRA